MPFVELFVPHGTLREDQRRVISERLVAEVMQAEGAPDTPAARSISWLLVHEVALWSVGGEEVRPGSQPRYVVRIAVPAGSLDSAKRADMIARVTAVLAEVDDVPSRLTDEPVAWVHINEIPEGNWGAFGRVVGLADVVSFVTREAA